MEQGETLVSLEYGDETAAVFRHPKGVLVLTRSLERGGATVLEGYRPAMVGLAGDQALQGGQLPPGASGAEVVDDRGMRYPAAAANGAWVVVLEQSSHGTSPVRFHDTDGSTVAPPLPEDWPRSPVGDAEEPCPACGACAWDEVHPLDESRGTRETHGPRDEPTPFAFCTECGHEESIGTFYGTKTSEDVDPEEVARRVREHELGRREKAHEALTSASFPIYVAARWPAEASGWGWGVRWPEDLHSIRITHGAWKEKSGATLTVETELEERAFESELAEARELLEESLYETVGHWPDLSEAALTVWLEARDRERRRIAAEARPQRRLIDVDGESHEFLVVQAGAYWAAAGRLGNVLLRVSARETPVEDLRLESLSDPVSIVED